MHATLIFPGIALPGFDSFKKKPTVEANFIDHGLASICQPAERSVFGNRIKLRSPRNVVDELLALDERFGFRSWMAHDDLFFINHRWNREFCDLYRGAGLTQPYICQMRADLICKYPDLVGRMAETGLAWAMIGFESGNQRILDFLQKETTVGENLRAAEICRESGVKVWANTMFGVPTEPREEVLDTVRMIWRMRPDHLSASFFTPTPGSDIAGEVERMGLAIVDPFEGSCRTPNQGKIRGVDYDWLARAIALAREGGPEHELVALGGLPEPPTESACESL